MTITADKNIIQEYKIGEGIPEYRKSWEEADSILLSNPKSGSTWLRFCIEFLSQRPTIGWSHEQVTSLACIDLPLLKQVECEKFNGFINDKFILAKTHEVGNFGPTKLILLLRNYKELISRPVYDLDASKRPLSSSDASDIIDQYVEKLTFYENFEGEKIIIYYEDLIKDFKSVMINLIDFLGLGDTGHSNLECFLKNFSELKSLSIDSYKKLPHIRVRPFIDETGEVNKFLGPKYHRATGCLSDCECSRCEDARANFNKDTAVFFKNYVFKESINKLQTSEYYFDNMTQDLYIRLRRNFSHELVAKCNITFSSYHKDYMNHPHVRETFEKTGYVGWAFCPLELFLLLEKTVFFVDYLQQYNAYTAESGDVKQHSNNTLSDIQKTKIDSVVREKLPHVFKKYLCKYEEQVDDLL